MGAYQPKDAHCSQPTDWLTDSATLEFCRESVDFVPIQFFRESCLFDLQFLSSDAATIDSVTDGVNVFDSSCAGLTTL